MIRHPVSFWIALKLHFVPRLRGNDNRNIFAGIIIFLKFETLNLGSIYMLQTRLSIYFNSQEIVV